MHRWLTKNPEHTCTLPSTGIDEFGKIKGYKIKIQKFPTNKYNLPLSKIRKLFTYNSYKCNKILTEVSKTYTLKSTKHCWKVERYLMLSNWKTILITCQYYIKRWINLLKLLFEKN